MLKPGDTFDRYTIEVPLGQGGMGCVYRAHDTRLGRRVALKVISDGPRDGPAHADANARLLREARAAAALDHPNAVSIFDVGELDGAPYIAMELVSGRTLREAVGESSSSTPSTPVETRAAWLSDVARALSAAHRSGLVHRDIKPENVMVRDDGVIKVLDFGIARRVSGSVDPSAPTQAPALPTLTKEGVKVGTPLYMAPEQIRGLPLDGRADQFAWGVLSYELLTGRLPWRGAGDALAVVASILTDTPEDAALTAAGVPPEAAAVVLRALSKKPEDRFASMDEAARALDAAMKGEPVVSSGAGPGRVSYVSPSARSAPVSPRASGASGASAPSAAAPPPAVAPGAPGPGATQLQRYSTEDVREILTRAIEQQESKRSDSRLGFDDLLSAAREVGVDPETLRQASRDLRVRGEASAARADYALWKRRKMRKFYNHLGTYVIVNLAFLVFSIAIGEAGPMSVALWWGIGLGMHGLKAFMANEDDYREERDKQDRKDRKEQRRAAVVERVIDEGTSLLAHTGASIRKRIDAPTPRPDRVRIGGDTRTEAEAEAEAAAERVEVKRRRS